MQYKSWFLNKIALLLLCLIYLSFSQEIREDSSATNMVDSVFTAKINYFTIAKSLLIPGWGQICQEKPGKAVIFYGMSAYFTHNSVFHYNRNADNSGRKLRQNLILLGQIYMLNAADVIATELYDREKSWQGKMFSDIPLKSPWGAVARSAMLPGWGQLYNEQYLKSLISIGLIGYFSYHVIDNTRKYKKTDNKIFRSRKSEKSWQLGFVYFLNMVDAYVDAYLFKFDDMMELTAIYNPFIEQTLVGVNFKF